MTSIYSISEIISMIENQQDNEKVKSLIKSERLYELEIIYAADPSENTLLHYAAKAGNHEIVQYLLDSGSEIHVPNRNGQCPLIASLDMDSPNKKVIQTLLEAGASVYILDYHDNNALNIVNSSAWLGEDKERFEILRLFLERANNFDNFTILETGNEKVITMLLETNVSLTIADGDGATLVHALAGNQNPAIVTLLSSKSFNVDLRDQNGWTPLMYAVRYSAVSTLEFLLDRGADIEAVDKSNKRTALYIACEIGYYEEGVKCIQALLEYGANAQVEVQDDLRPTIFDLVLQYDMFWVSELILANLALREANGTVITQVIHSKIQSHRRFENFFERCKHQLAVEIYRSVTLIDVLNSSERKLERYLRNKDLASNLTVFQAVDYFDKILHRRLSKAVLMFELRKTAVNIVCNLLKMDYDRYPFIADEIVSYLDKTDIDHLNSIFNPH